MWTDIRVLQHLKNGKSRNRNEIVSYIIGASKELHKMVIAGLLRYNPITEEYSITKIGLKELEYYRTEREGMENESEELMIDG